MKTIIKKTKYQCKFCKTIYEDINLAYNCERNCSVTHSISYQIGELKTKILNEENINNFILFLEKICDLRKITKRNFKEDLELEGYQSVSYGLRWRFKYNLYSFLSDNFQINFKDTEIYKQLEELNNLDLKEKKLKENILIEESKEYQLLSKKIKDENDNFLIKYEEIRKKLNTLESKIKHLEKIELLNIQQYECEKFNTFKKKLNLK